MKVLKSIFTIYLLLAAFITTAQKVELAGGDITKLKGEKTINIEFNYDRFGVGEYSSEKEYVKKKTEEYNAKEAGSGDKWALQWVADRKERYEPKFIELFTIHSGMTFDTTAKYTLVFKTTFLEPGFQVAIKKKAAEVDGTATFVETANRGKKIATITVEKGGSTMFKGASFDAAGRITEAYASAAKKMGVLVKKEANTKED